MKLKFKRGRIPQHKVLQDPAYRAREEKHKKVLLREQEDKEAEEAIRRVEWEREEEAIEREILADVFGHPED